MCASVKAYGDVRAAKSVALADASGFTSGDALGRVEAAKVSAEIKKLKAELAKITVVDNKN